MNATIYQPTKNAMQSGLANTKRWILEFRPPNSKFIEPIMGWTSDSDTVSSQVKLSFSSKEEAIAYAEREGLNYEVKEPNQSRRIIKTYVSNFKQ